MDPRFTRLKSWLQNADLQKKNYPLYQVLSGLIDFLNKEQAITNTEIGDTGSSISSIINSDILTFSDESAFLPQSRQLIAGSGIDFDDITPGERSISSIVNVDYYWTLLTDGVEPETDLIYANGDVIAVQVPNP